MADRFHIIITGEDGHSSVFQLSRRKIFLSASVCLVTLGLFFIVLFTGGGSLFTSRHLNQQLVELKTELSAQEQAAAVFQEQIARLERAKHEQLESLKEEYEYKLSNQKEHSRMTQDVVVPLQTVSSNHFPSSAQNLERLRGRFWEKEDEEIYAETEKEIERIIKKLRGVLANMLKLESYTEIVRHLRTIMKTHREATKLTEEDLDNKVKDILDLDKEEDK